MKARMRRVARAAAALAVAVMTIGSAVSASAQHARRSHAGPPASGLAGPFVSARVFPNGLVPVRDAVATRGRWTSHGVPGAIVTALAILPTNPAMLYLGTADAGVFTSTDGGRSWSRASRGLPDAAVTALAIDPSHGRILHAGTGKGLFRSNDRGRHWAEGGLRSKPVSSLVVDPSHPEVLYAAAGYTVFKSVDGGDHWTKANSGLGPGIRILAIDPQDPTVLYAAGYRGVQATRDGGKHWTDAGLAAQKVRTLAFDPHRPETVWAGTASPAIVFERTNGRRWIKMDPGLHARKASVTSLAFDPRHPGVAYAGVNGRRHRGVFKTVDGGSRWTAVNTGLTDTHITTVVTDPRRGRTLYVGTTGVGVFKSSNGGDRWSLIDHGLVAISVPALVVDPTDPNAVYAGTPGAGAFRSPDRGSHWMPIRTGLTSVEVRSLAIDPQHPAVLYAGTRRGIYKTTNAGARWGVSVSNDCACETTTVLAIAPSDPNTVYSNDVYPCPDFGVCAAIGKTTDGGTHWTFLYPDFFPDGANDLDVDPTDAGVVYAALGDAVFKTADGGDTWSPGGDMGRLTVYAVAIDPTNPQAVYAGTSAGVFASVDGSDDWTANGLHAKVVTALVIDPALPATLYAGTLTGVFATTDGGVNWVKMDAGLTTRHVLALAIDASGHFLHAGTQGGGVFDIQVG